MKRKDKSIIDQRQFFLSIIFFIGVCVGCMGEVYSKAPMEIGRKNNPGKALGGELILMVNKDIDIDHGKENTDYFKMVSNLVLDRDNNLYALDTKNYCVYKFDTKGIPLFKSGKKGEGPGEFQNPRSLFVNSQQEIFVLDNYYIHKFNSQGHFDKKIKVNEYILNFMINEKNEVIFTSLNEVNGIRQMSLNKYWPNLNKYETIKSFNSGKQVDLINNNKKTSFFLEHEYSPQLCFAVMINGRCVIGFNLEYELTIYDSLKNLFYFVKMNELPIGISSAEKDAISKNIFEGYKNRWPNDIIKKAIQFSDHRPYFSRILSDDQDNLFVEKMDSVLKNEDKKYFTFNYFNSKGVYLREVKFSVYPEIINNGFVYSVNDSNEDKLTIQRYQILNWSKLTEQQ